MSIPFWWLPNLLCTTGLLLCAIQGWRQRSLGHALLAVFFAYNLSVSIVAAVRQHEYLREFVQQQTGPNTWTAPVVHVNVAAPFTYGLLVLAAFFLSRRLAARPAV
jgi:hypothetical protein